MSEKAMLSWRHFVCLVVQVGQLAKDVRNLEGCAV